VKFANSPLHELATYINQSNGAGRNRHAALADEDAARRVEVPHQHVIRTEAQQSGARSITSARERRTRVRDVCCRAIYDFRRMWHSDLRSTCDRCEPDG
jgi:hypothetical protein